MKMTLILNILEVFTEGSRIMSLSISGIIAPFGARMNGSVKNKLFK